MANGSGIGIGFNQASNVVFNQSQYSPNAYQFGEINPNMSNMSSMDSGIGLQVNNQPPMVQSQYAPSNYNFQPSSFSSAESAGGGFGDQLAMLGYSSNPAFAALQVAGNVASAVGSYNTDQRTRDAYSKIGEEAMDLSKTWKNFAKGYQSDANAWEQGGRKYNFALGTMRDTFETQTSSLVDQYEKEGIMSATIASKLYNTIDDKVGTAIPGLEMQAEKMKASYLGKRDQATTMYDNLYAQGVQAQVTADMYDKEWYEYIPEALGV